MQNQRERKKAILAYVPSELPGPISGVVEVVVHA